jgi:hypothetical protein
VWSAAGWLLAIVLIVALKRDPTPPVALILVGSGIFSVLTNAYVSGPSRADQFHHRQREDRRVLGLACLNPASIPTPGLY